MREHDNLADDLLTDAAKGLGKEGGGFWSSTASESQRQRAVRIAPYRRGGGELPRPHGRGTLATSLRLIPFMLRAHKVGSEDFC